MADFDDMTDEEIEAEIERRKKKKQGEKAGSARGKQRPEISEAAQQLMRERGFTMQQITDLLKNWKYLGARDVAVRLAEFSADKARASAHIAVSFTKDAGFALVSHFVKYLEHFSEVTQRLTAERNQKLKNDRRDNNLG